MLPAVFVFITVVVRGGVFACLTLSLLQGNEERVLRNAKEASMPFILALILCDSTPEPCWLFVRVHKFRLNWWSHFIVAAVDQKAI